MIIANLNGPLSLFTEVRRNLPVARKDRAKHVLRPVGLNGRLNLGDMFVIRATADQIDADEVYHIAINADQSSIDLINERCDIMILKGGNFLKPNWISENIPYSFISRIKIPIVIIGYGMQGQIDNLYLKDEDIKTIKYIHDSCKSVMVRGDSTAEYLKSIGVENAKVIGCPTLFLSRKPTIEVKNPSLDSVTWTFRNNLYTKKDEMYNWQFDSIEWLNKQAKDFTVMLQGEEASLQSYVAHKKWGSDTYFEERKEGNVKVTSFHKVNIDDIENSIVDQFGKWSSKELLHQIKDKTFFSYDIDEYLNYLYGRSLIAGCRLHGNLMALSQGVPVVYYIYDQRSLEIVNLMKIPSVDMRQGICEFNINDLDYSEFEKSYSALYKDYKFFLEENNIAHKLS